MVPKAGAGRTVAPTMVKRLHEAWLNARCYLIGARIAWPATTSVVVGALLFLYTAPAQDILLELRGDPKSDAVFWGKFYLVVILAWALPVYISARWLLSHFEESSKESPHIERLPAHVTRSVPALLAAACFFAVLLGQLLALRNAPTVDTEIREQVVRNLEKDYANCKASKDDQCSRRIKQFKTVRLADEFSEALGGEVNIPFVLYGMAAIGLLWLVLLSVLRVMCSPSTVRRSSATGAVLALAALAVFHAKTYPLTLSTLDTYAGKIDPTLVRLAPLAILPLVVFLAWRGWTVALWCLAAVAALPGAALFGWALYGIVLVERVSPLSLVHLHLLPAATVVAAALTWWGLRARTNSKVSWFGQGLVRLFYGSGQAAPDLVNRAIVNPLFHALLAMTVAVIVVLVVLHPLTVTEYLNRGLLLPIIFGLPVATFTYLSYWSASLRAPLVALAILLIAATGVLTDWFWGDYHSVRMVEKVATRPTLRATAEQWARANECDLPTLPGASRRCPSPIILAAAGGASRAAFQVAGVVGHLMDGEKFLPIRGHRGLVYSPALSKDGKLLVTASSDGTARVWTADTGVALFALRGHTASVRSAAFSPDSRRIVTASFDRTARVWDAADGKELLVLSAHAGPVFSAAFSNDGSLIVTASEDKTVRVWDAATGAERAVLNSHKAGVRGAVFDGTGKKVVSGSWDKTIRLWELSEASGKAEVATSRVLNEGLEITPIYSIAIDPAGTRVMAAGGDGSARIYDIADGKLIATLVGHAGLVHQAIFSNDGKRAVTSAWDHTARLWELSAIATAEGSPKLIKSIVLKGHTNDVNGAAFSPWDDRIITASDDGTARLWDARTGLRKAWSDTEKLRPFHTQLFAISAVSGGALGAAAYYAALSDSQVKTPAAADGGRTVGSSGILPPCNTAAIQDPEWFASEIGGARAEPLDPRESWKDCLQLLVAGDFLSPVFVGLVSRDWLPVPFSWRGDRAQRLEEAWEARYARLTSTGAGSVSASQLVGTSTMAKSLAEIRKETLDRDPKAWLPMLLFNGTSVEDGRRIITSDVDTLTRGRSPTDLGIVKSRIFRDAHDFHDLFSVHSSGGHNGIVISVAFSPDGTRVVTASFDKTARIWDVAPAPRWVSWRVTKSKFTVQGSVLMANAL
jgi:WD40 repeat protein